MLTDNQKVEIFYKEGDLWAITQGKVLPFAEWPSKLTAFLEAEMEDDQEVMAAFIKAGTPKADRLWVYAKCAYGAFDVNPDLCMRTRKKNHEPWNCGCVHCPLKDVLKNGAILNGAHLTNKEVEVVREIATGKPGKQIAAELGICQSTFDNHKTNIYRKTSINCNVELVLVAQSNSLL